jgi:DNA-binding MarR family transcriptional regulator
VTDGLGPLGLTFSQYLCLRVLSVNSGMSSAELARALNVSPQAMNTVLRGLEGIGAVSRPASVPVGRALPARVTAAATALLERTDAVVQRAETAVLSGLTKAEQRELKRMLESAGSAT